MKRLRSVVVEWGSGGTMRGVSLGLLFAMLTLFLGCAHSTRVTSDRDSAQVFVDGQKEPVGTTPVDVPATSRLITVAHDDERVSFTMETQVEPIATCTNTLLATCVAAGIIGVTGAAFYGLGLLLSWAAPAVGPIVAFFGGPPAFVGTAFWMIVGGAVCGALSLPFAACGSGQKGPDTVHVSFADGKVRASPDGAVREAPRSVDEGNSRVPIDDEGHETAPQASPIVAMRY
jgi:hypothetical protein